MNSQVRRNDVKRPAIVLRCPHLLPVLVDSSLHLEYILRDTNATLRGDLAVDELILVRVIILITPIEGLLIDRGGHIDCGYCVERPELVRLAASVKGSLQPT